MRSTPIDVCSLTIWCTVTEVAKYDYCLGSTEKTEIFESNMLIPVIPLLSPTSNNAIQGTATQTPETGKHKAVN